MMTLVAGAVARPVRSVLLLLLICGLSAGCGSDDVGTNPTGDGGPDLDGALQQLADFGGNALKDPGSQMVASSQVLALLAVLPLSLDNAPLQASALPAGVTLQDYFGTYQYDASDMTQPFPQWILLEAGVPNDGFVFRFTENDGFFYWDGNNNPVPLQGEIRLVKIAIDMTGPASPDDDILTAITFELAAGNFNGVPQPPENLETLVRLNVAITLGAGREVEAVRLGDPSATSPADAEAAFLGSLLLAVTLAMNDDDIDLFVQVSDAVHDYVLAGGISILDLLLDPQGELASLGSVDLSVAFGETSNPADPPWQANMIFSNFPTPPDLDNLMADVEGGITNEGVAIATFGGTTAVVPYDIDGNGTADPGETCVDITVTFADAPETPESICDVVRVLIDELNDLPVLALKALSTLAR